MSNVMKLLIIHFKSMILNKFHKTPIQIFYEVQDSMQSRTTCR